MMKTRMIKISLALAVIVAAGYTAYSSHTETQLSGTALENVEALASGETTSGTTHSLDCGSSGLKMCEATCGRCNVTLRAWGNGGSAILTCSAH